jgi:hypothetical protein
MKRTESLIVRSESSPGALVAPVIAPFEATCAANGIRKTTAWKLAKLGMLETISIGRRRFVVLSSLNSLPKRLQLLKREDV